MTVTGPITSTARVGTSDPLRGVVDLTKALGEGIAQGQADVAAIEKNLGISQSQPPPPAPKEDTSRNVVILVVGGLVLVGVVAVVLYVVTRGAKAAAK